MKKAAGFSLMPAASNRTQCLFVDAIEVGEESLDFVLQCLEFAIYAAPAPITEGGSVFA